MERRMEKEGGTDQLYLATPPIRNIISNQCSSLHLSSSSSDKTASAIYLNVPSLQGTEDPDAISQEGGEMCGEGNQRSSGTKSVTRMLMKARTEKERKME